MATQQSFFEETRKALGSTIGPHARKAMQGPLIRAGVEEVGWGFGLGPKGLFNRSTFDPFFSAAGTPRSAGLRTALRAAGGKGWKGFAKRAGKRALGPVSTLAFAGITYHHLRQQGHGQLSAGAMAVGGEIAFSFAAGAAMKGLSMVAGGAMTYAAPIAAVAAVGYGTYKALEHGNAVLRNSRRLEMGKQVADPYGINATMRQRSLQAMSFSQINGRSAFGSEAQLMHIPMMRG